MGSGPLVSVVIPAYNVESYIGETLDSVLNQTFGNYEIIIVDDGSTDRSADIVKGYCEQNNCISYIYQENRGVSAARNTGIQNSRGDYIAFLDSDDLWMPTKLEKQMQRIAETGMDGCYCGYQEYFGSSLGKSFPERYFEGNILLEILEEKTSAWTSTWVIKRDILQKYNLKFTEGLHWGEDMEFFAKVATFARVCAVKEKLALYRQRENSLSSSPDRSREIEIWSRYARWLEKQDNVSAYGINDIVDRINTYRVPGIAVFCLFEKKAAGGAYLTVVDQPQLEEYAKHYKANLSSPALKLLIKRYMLKMKLPPSLLKLFHR